MQRPIPSGSGALLSPCSSVLHDSVTGGCRLGGRRTTGSKPILNSSMAISKRLAAIKNFGIDPWISIRELNKDAWHRRVEGVAFSGRQPCGRRCNGCGLYVAAGYIDAIRSFREILD